MESKIRKVASIALHSTRPKYNYRVLAAHSACAPQYLSIQFSALEIIPPSSRLSPLPPSINFAHRRHKSTGGEKYDLNQFKCENDIAVAPVAVN